MERENPFGGTKPCANPKGCDGQMRYKIVAPIQRPGVVKPMEPYGAWVCPKCGFETSN